MSRTGPRALLIAFAMVLVGVSLLVWLGSSTVFRTDRVEGDGRDAIPIDAGPDAFTIHGGIDAPLTPGASRALDLEFRNPSEEDLTIGDLEVSLAEIDAPNATSLLPCSPSDFVVQQGAGSLQLDAARTATLSSSGWKPEQWPRIGLRETGANQDGCKGASLALDYQASGEVRG